MKRNFEFKPNYVWFSSKVSVDAYDLKQARKKLKKKLARYMSVPKMNSFIKAKNIKLKLLGQEKPKYKGFECYGCFKRFDNDYEAFKKHFCDL